MRKALDLTAEPPRIKLCSAPSWSQVRILINRNTAEPPVSNHPKCKDVMVVITRGGRLQESNERGPLPRRGLGTSTYGRQFIACNF